MVGLNSHTNHDEHNKKNSVNAFSLIQVAIGDGHIYDCWARCKDESSSDTAMVENVDTWV